MREIGELCSVAEEQEEGRQVEGHSQSLNLGEGLNVGHEGGIHRGIGSDDRPDTAWLSRRLHSAIVQAAHTSSSMAALLIRDGHA